MNLRALKALILYLRLREEDVVLITKLKTFKQEYWMYVMDDHIY